MLSASSMRWCGSGQRECSALTARGNARTCRKNSTAKHGSPVRSTAPSAIRCQSGWPPKLRRASISSRSESAKGRGASAAGSDMAAHCNATLPRVRVDLDLKSPSMARDPYPAFAELRDRDPVHWSESLGAWVVTRYADVLEIWNQPELFSSDRFRRVRAEFTSQRPEVRAVAAVLSKWLVFRDPPDHTRLRALLQKAFTPRQLANSRARIQAAIDDALAKSEIDFVSQFAFPLPALVIAPLLGAPGEDIEAIKQWSDQLAAYLGGSLDGQDNFTRARAGVEGLVAYFGDLLREKRRRPGEDLIGLMLRAEHDGHTLSGDEIVSNCVLLLFAGHETTTHLLANGLLHLLRDPDARAQLRAQPELDASAVEELLRIESPVPATVKVATRDVAFRDARLRAGEMVLPFLSSANRDPRQFADP